MQSTDSQKPADASAANDAVEWPPVLALETEPVLRLFTGESFYSAADAAIREAVLNAIDAISRRRDNEPAIEQTIRIVFDSAQLTLTISDNGDGMSQNDLANLFSKVGASASRLRQSTKGSTVIGTFGIGALSYFLVCDKYHVHTLKKDQSAIGLEFSSAMLDGRTRAKNLEATRTENGTTVTMFLKSKEVLKLLVDRFPHWIRDVRGLTARIEPDGKDIKQGGLTREVRRIEPQTVPDWVEEADIGPAKELSVWDSYDGRGRVDVLYRGVFVERAELQGLWGLEGAIHVDPKHFRPKLNREGFIGQDLVNQITPFLAANHPLILRDAVKCIRALLESNDAWNFSRALTLWLAVPRRDNYKEAAAAWDAEFRERRAFRQLEANAERDVSVAELVAMGASKIYLAPDRLDKVSDVVRQAVRVLRARNEVIVQGIPRDGGYLTSAPVNAASTLWLLLHTFKDELPPLLPVDGLAENLVRQDSLADVLTTAPKVKLVRLGKDSAPIVAIREEIWINIDTPAGCSIVEEICRRNEGHLALWVACMMYAPEHGERLNQIGMLLRGKKQLTQRLGLVRRQYLRNFLQ